MFEFKNYIVIKMSIKLELQLVLFDFLEVDRDGQEVYLSFDPMTRLTQLIHNLYWTLCFQRFKGYWVIIGSGGGVVVRAAAYGTGGPRIKTQQRQKNSLGVLIFCNALIMDTGLFSHFFLHLQMCLGSQRAFFLCFLLNPWHCRTKFTTGLYLSLFTIPSLLEIHIQQKFGFLQLQWKGR